MITDCPKCGKLYEEKSEEEAYSPNRSCLQCYQKAYSWRRQNGMGALGDQVDGASTRSENVK